MNQTAKLVIVGAGGLGREVLATARACNTVQNRWEILGFLDSNRSLPGSEVGGVPVLGDDGWCAANRDDNCRYVCAIGRPDVRAAVVRKLAGMNCRFATPIRFSAARGL